MVHKKKKKKILDPLLNVYHRKDSNSNKEMRRYKLSILGLSNGEVLGKRGLPQERKTFTLDVTKDTTVATS